MSPVAIQQSPMQREGVTVVGEAVRRVAPESVEFLFEISAGASTAAQALRDNQAKNSQIAHALGALGVIPADLRTISVNVYSVYGPVLHSLAAAAGMQQIGQGPPSPYSMPAPSQPELQLGNYQARNVVRVTVRDPGRAGEIVDTAVRAGAAVAGGFSFRAGDETAARRAALEAATRDARSKAEAVAAAAGKQIGDAISISEDMVVSNGTYAALRSAMPYAFGAGAPQVAGDLEYYARVSANFRFQ
jgi:uncharacterized protein YggE